MLECKTKNVSLPQTNVSLCPESVQSNRSTAASAIAGRYLFYLFCIISSPLLTILLQMACSNILMTQTMYYIDIQMHNDLRWRDCYTLQQSDVLNYN